MSAKLCLLFLVKVIILLLLYNLHDCTFNSKILYNSSYWYHPSQDKQSSLLILRLRIAIFKKALRPKLVLHSTLAAFLMHLSLPNSFQFVTPEVTET